MTKHHGFLPLFLCVANQISKIVLYIPLTKLNFLQCSCRFMLVSTKSTKSTNQSPPNMLFTMHFKVHKDVQLKPKYKSPLGCWPPLCTWCHEISKYSYVKAISRKNFPKCAPDIQLPSHVLSCLPARILWFHSCIHLRTLLLWAHLAVGL